MDLDLETFFIALYVIVDDLYQSHMQPRMPSRGGPPAEMSDSEVLCLGLAAQWRSGVPWHTERGVLRYGRKHLRHVFPTLLSQSAFNTFIPGPEEITLPFTLLTLQGLHVEPSNITDFKGVTALAYHVGTVTGSDGLTYNLETGAQVHDYNGGIPPLGCSGRLRFPLTPSG